MKKRHVSIALIAIGLMVNILCVNAAELSIDVKIIDSANEKICISGAISPNDAAENRLATVISVPSGTDVTDINVLAQALAYTSAEIKSDGTYMCTIGFSQQAGIYDFYVMFDNEVSKIPFKYIGIESVANLIKQIADGTIRKDEILQKITEYEAYLPIDMNDFDDEFKKCLLVYRLDKNRSEIAVDGNYSSVVASFGQLVSYIKEEMDFVNKYNEVSYYGNYYKLLSENTKYTGIDFTTYNSLSETKKTHVLKLLLRKKAANADEIKTIFDAAVNEARSYVEPSSDNTTGRGGGSGGGSVSRSFDTDSATQPEPDYSQPLFDDIYGVTWAGEAITRLAEKGVISGTSEKKFEPNENITREQFAKLICGILGLYDATLTSRFDDVSNNMWYASYTASIENAGIINGVGNNNFGVGQYITRQDMAVMIYNALQYKNISLTDIKNGFIDFDKISDYAKDAVSYLAGAGIINGYDNGNFAPTDNATRAESAVLIYALERRITQ